MKKLAVFTLVFFVVNLYAQVNFTSSNLPIIIINTNGKEIPDEPKIDATMSVIDNGVGKRNYLTDPINGFNGKIGIEIRGQSSTQFPKKQYGVETRDNSGNDLDVALLGLPEESDWVLNANYLDKTFMRNYLAYTLYASFGRYATRTRFCEVVLNNQYIGLYILQEKIKRDKNRVNIAKLETTDNSGDALTGGYIVRIDKIDTGDQYWSSSILPYEGARGKIYYQYYHPKAEDITAAQKQYISNYVTSWENVLNSTAYNDPFAGYTSFVDENSFIDMFILNEFTKGTDAYRISSYLYKERDSKGGKLFMGPPWDYDIAFGVADYDNGYLPTGWQVFYRNGGTWENPFWSTKLFNDPMFSNKFIKRWNELKNTTLSLTNVYKLIDDKILEIQEAVNRNFQKWKILGTYVWPNKYVFNTYADEVLYLKNWIRQRYEWMDATIPKTYSEVEWNNVDMTKYVLSYGKSKNIPFSVFIKSQTKIDSYEFVCQDGTLSILQQADTLTLKPNRPAEYKIKCVARFGGGIVSISPEYIFATTTGIKDENSISADFQLEQNYPNPFNPQTEINYYLPKPGFVTLKIFDQLGSEITTLVNEYKPAGSFIANFNSTKFNMSSGLYFYKLLYNEFSITKKMILLK